jgi:hypothetical protein
LLVHQIVDDEIRHHQQFAELRDSLRAELEQRGAKQPSGNGRRPCNPRDLLDRTEQLLALEKADIRELRRLARQLKKVEDTAWRAVIVESMELDTRKHIRLLEAVRDLLSDEVGRQDHAG